MLGSLLQISSDFNFHTRNHPWKRARSAPCFSREWTIPQCEMRHWHFDLNLSDVILIKGKSRIFKHASHFGSVRSQPYLFYVSHIRVSSHASAHCSLFGGRVALWWGWEAQMAAPKVDEARRYFLFCCAEMEWSSVLNNRALVLRVILSMYAPFVEFALEVNRRQICKLTIDVFATIHQRGKHQLTVRQYVVKKLHFSEPVGPVQSRPTVRR